MNEHRSMDEGSKNHFPDVHPGPDVHLNDEQFAECALGLAVSGDAAVHLAECAQCSAELATFGMTMEEFSSAALGWSESRSPLSLQQHTRNAAVSRPRFVTASWALAAGMLLAVGGSMLTHRHVETGPDVAVAGTEVDTETEIAKDNELMRSVNMAIGEGVPSPVREYSLDAADGNRRRTTAESRTE